MSQATFIHTADLHLREMAGEPLELLRWLVGKCVEREAALLVAGDLFYSADEADGLQEEVKEVFGEGSEIPKFILPGENDTGAFTQGADYGPGVHLLSGAPFTVGSHRGIEIVGFPFTSNSSLRAQIDDYRAPDKPLVAVAHGTYFGRGHAAFFEDVRERGEEYFPIYGSDVNDIGAGYVALGHYHSQHISFVHGDSVVCYPGTPIALSSKEVGIRTVVAVTIDTETGETDIERLPVPVGAYNIREDIEVFACAEEEGFSRLERALQERADARAALTVRLKGNIHMLERDMNDRLAGLRQKHSGRYGRLVVRNETVSYRSLIDERPLVREFMAKLAAVEDLDEEARARALELGLRAFDKVKGHMR